MTNNIMVTIWAVLLGLFFGFARRIVTLNGILLGVVFAFTGRYGVATNSRASSSPRHRDLGDPDRRRDRPLARARASRSARPRRVTA